MLQLVANQYFNQSFEKKKKSGSTLFEYIQQYYFFIVCDLEFGKMQKV